MTQPPPATVVPLWETDHPYYCTEGNYYRNGNHLTYDSWAAFHAEWGGLDPDMNLVFRWDWQRADPADYAYELEQGEELPGDTLKVFWVLQRKAILRSTECAITEADEPAVRAWLTERAAHMRLLWEPLLPAPAA
ncbi:hypothetical protein YUYDRAFT_02112 [Streptomyces sp. ScaeMP-e48]|uniref:hypothetical protein n=1 Tax=Streptomyces sp. ScaeMP-e48 TaxID=1100823 RepID=UPI000823C279|nr:hypothetical protein [Streptomyces sp. ScaeMP-e48]SCK20289.1 hypothetical protein YUYDRAFT_02112 [Streptomyces sp. ScaeMP-e48]